MANIYYKLCPVCKERRILVDEDTCWYCAPKNKPKHTKTKQNFQQISNELKRKAKRKAITKRHKVDKKEA